jgi:hypothetical protein
MDNAFRVLHRLAAEYGPLLAAVLLIGAAAFFLVFLYLVLEYGERAAKMFIPFASSAIRTLAGEKDNKHPAIRVEYAMHRIMLLLFFACLGVRVVHSLIPWSVNINEQMLDVLLVSFVVVGCLLGGVSLRFALRLR